MDVTVIPRKFLANPRWPFLGKWRMHPFVHLSTGFWLYTALPYRSSKSSNCLVFSTPRIISSSLTAFLFLILRSTESSSSFVNSPSFMSNCLLMILVIGSCVPFGGFPSKFLKCCFHCCIRSCWLVAFSLAFAVLFLLITSFIVCHVILDCLLIWFCIYSVCSFWCMLTNPFCAFLSFKALILVGFFLLHLEAVFTSACFSLTAIFSHGTLGLALCLVVMHSAAASKWALTKFPYSSFEVCVSVFSCCASDLFLCVNAYLSLISLL